MASSKPPAFKIPKKLANVADMLYETRLSRLAIQKQVDELTRQEGLLKSHLIENLPKSEASGIAGLVARAKIDTQDVPRVVDWELFHAYVKKTGDFSLMQRRVSSEAIKERWEAGKKLPGVDVFKVVTVSCTKV